MAQPAPIANGERQLTPERLFEQFERALSDTRIGAKAIGNFVALEDKSSFLEPTMQFLAKEERDAVRSWGTNVLELIGGDKSFRVLADLLRKEKTKEAKRGYRYTRFFTLRAVAHLAKSENQRRELLTLLEQIWNDDAEDYLIQAEASILLAQQGRSEPKAKVRDRLRDFSNYWATSRALRALREFTLFDLADEIISVMRNSDYIDHKYDAIRVLGAYTDNLVVVRALGDAVISSRISYLRLEAVKSLAKLGHPGAQADVVQALHDEDAEVRAQASRALRLLLGEDAVSVIVQRALREGIGEEELAHLLEALRRIDPGRSVSTETLSKELAGEDRRRAELAERMLVDLGGWAAVQRLSQRRNTLNSLDKLLAESEQGVKKTFEDTIRQARRNFYFAMGVNILVVSVGLILVILAIAQLIQSPEKLEGWIIPGAGGVFGVLISQYFNNPRRNAREDLTALMNVNMIFLGFLRQLNEIDATFKYAYIESRTVGEVAERMTSTVQQISDAVRTALHMAESYLKTTPPTQASTPPNKVG